MILAEPIETALGSIQASLVTDVFVIALIVIFIVSVRKARAGVRDGLVHYTPNLLTSLGILGTFVGIVIGLIGFDVTSIDDSVAPLLDGLKTAFITSLVGMLLAIVFKSLDSAGLLSQAEPGEEPGSASPEDILGTLEEQKKGIDKMAASIAGNEDSSLVSQTRLLRSDLKDMDKERRKEHEEFAEKLWEQMNGFAEMLSKSATEQVVSALKEVISDFNNNLTEQFGENFKELNSAVHRLVEWQDQYRVQMEQMAEQYKLGVSSIESTRDAVERISAETSVIKESMERLREVMEKAGIQIDALDSHLESFAEVKDRAVEALPQISGYIDDMSKEVAKASTEAAQAITESSRKSSEAITTGAQSFESSVQSASDALRRQHENMERGYENLNSKMESAVAQAEEVINKEIKAIDEAMQAEIERAMTEMGRALAGITNHMVDDYQKLVRTMDAAGNRRPGVSEHDAPF